ncbi:MAG: HAD-IIB family hydrolase [Thiobacillus sp.]|uniref:HAD-IIB family hydrolase n=1 Tax=Thiobacillus sp. TaxID=924 RepID=UPI002733DDC3|nr:HAD-IIB family hydrolase [Thiobacillus sp.]MDP3586346.1 HAD-IIB family hydrolase [Thiobacillus sp.]
MRDLYVLMLSVHGLMRGHDLELGRDADTGGQTLYVIELARALGRHPRVEQVDVLTRLIDDPAVSTDYAAPTEMLGERARLVRLPCGPRRYLRKESLWNHLDQLVDRTISHLRQQPRLPDIIHSHYADAGHVGVQLSQLLGIPLVHTGHSLGRCKRQRLLDHGRRAQTIERQFNFVRRIAAEEAALAQASLVVTSTAQESVEQYGLYHHHQPSRMVVIAPGTDTSRFAPPGREPIPPHVPALVDRFLTQPKKPLILAICRPEVRKNLGRLVAAYGESPELRERANLAIVAGNRDDIRTLDEAQADVLKDLLLDVDRYDLWGSVALPKQHQSDDIPALYRLAAQRRGVFVNPALTEPFGLTLIEAAASGLPVVATRDGGPPDILAHCENGVLVDPLDPADIARGLLAVVSDARTWQRYARRGINGVTHHYTWDAHVDKYLRAIDRVVYRSRKQVRRERVAQQLHHNPMPYVQRMLVSDIDNTLIGDRAGLAALVRVLRERPPSDGFGVATGRHLPSALAELRQARVPLPDVLITAVGSEIHYGPELRPDVGWQRHIQHLWRRDALAALFEDLPGLTLQSGDQQSEYKLSFNVDPATMPSLRQIDIRLREHRLRANLIYSHQAYLDVLPIRASKGQAIRYLAYKWSLPLRAFLVAGDSGNDLEMLVGDTQAVVVSNHSVELEKLRGMDQVYFADTPCASGILEGMAHYGFVGEPLPVPQPQAA